MRFSAILGAVLAQTMMGASVGTMHQQMAVEHRVLRDIFGTDPVPRPRAGVGGVRTQRHTGAGGAGMTRAAKKRRAAGRA